MIILAIETSCDETAMALVKCSGGLRKPQFKILKNVVSSQIAVHRPFHGVVPNLAKREHIKNLPIVLKKILNPKSKILNPNYIAVTVGPGLEPALWTGINFSEELAKKLKKPLIAVNHMEGHLYSNWIKKSKIQFPAIALIVSGGHTILLNMKSATQWTKLGETLDDAAGEAFDKVARMLELPYPGGPEIQRSAAKGNPKAMDFPRPMLNKKNYEFSFSGLKTSVLYYLRDNPRANKANVAASFQQAVIDVLVKKSVRAAQEFKTKSILLCGGVAANKPLREAMNEAARELKQNFVVPDFEFNTDNAAMAAAAAYLSLLNKRHKPLKFEAQGNLSI